MSRCTLGPPGGSWPRSLSGHFAATSLLALAALFALAPDVFADAQGTWSTLPSYTASTPPTRRADEAFAFDTRHGRLIVFGGYDMYDGVLRLNDTWARTFGPTGAWTKLAIGGSPPSARNFAALAYDAIGDRFLLFGGVSDAGLLNDVWSLSLAGSPTWTPLATTGTPPSARYTHQAVFDSLRNRLLVFGGTDATGPRNDVWALDLAGTPTWSLIGTNGAPPAPRSQPTVVLDTGHDALVVFGGTGSLSGEPAHVLDDTWTLSLAGSPTWSEAQPTGPLPPPRRAAGACYDAVHQRMVVAFGFGASAPLADAWVLDLGAMAWSPLPASPLAARGEPEVFYDNFADRVWARGGRDLGGGVVSNVVLFTDGAGLTPLGWILLDVSAPNGLLLSQAVDSIHHRLVLFGGTSVFVLGLGQGGAWEQVVPEGSPPYSVNFPAVAFDPIGNRIVGYGGTAVFGNPSPDPWQLSLDNPATWSALPAGGPQPPTMETAHGIDDASHRRMIVVPGAIDTSAAPAGIWTLSLDSPPTWTAWPRFPEDTLLTRSEAASAYDPVQDRILVFGGARSVIDGPFASHTQYFADLWAYSLATPHWEQLATAGTPPSPRAASAIYDAGRRRMVVFGGATDTGPSGEIWALRLDQDPPVWTQLSPTGAPPPLPDLPFFLREALYDTLADAMIVPAGDTYVLTWGDYSTATLPGLVESGVDGLHVRLVWFTADGAGTDARAERTVDGVNWATLGRLVADASGRLVLDEAVPAAGRYGYRLEMGTDGFATEVTWVDVSASAAAALGLARPWPNPSPGGPTLAFTLTGGVAPAVLAVYDVGGHRVLRRDVGGLGPGPHLLDLRGLVPARAGIYFAMLRDGGRTTTRRFAILP